ncbi:uncharacterized protein [Ptychodera flava]|uniref:uncharacterized protein n=1 Tax=Ptychodera flava TaxID=63121 RepID=UPI003969EF07
MASGAALVGACGGGDPVDELSEELASVLLHDDDAEWSDVDDDELPLSPDGECPEYRLGQCNKPADCTDDHPHINFPCASQWNGTLMSRLRFQASELDVTNDNGELNFPIEEVVTRWLIDNPDVPDIQNLPAPLTPQVELQLHRKEIKIEDYCEFLRRSVPAKIEVDDFINFVTEFHRKHSMVSGRMRNLVAAAIGSDIQNVHRKTMLLWLMALKAYRNGTLREALLDHLFGAIIAAAEFETGSTVAVLMREAAGHTIVVCGQPVAVQVDVEVFAGNGLGLMQILTFSENKLCKGKAYSYTVPVLPQSACEALAIAPSSPFGNGKFKTVYQVSVYVSYGRNKKRLEMSITLMKFSVSRETLKDMKKCPIRNPLEQSYITHLNIPCGSIESPQFVLVAYKAIKAVLLVFRGLNYEKP